MFIYAEPASFHIKTVFLLLLGSIIGTSFMPMFNELVYIPLVLGSIGLGAKAYTSDFRKSYFVMVFIIGLIIGSLAHYNYEKDLDIEAATQQEKTHS